MTDKLLMEQLDEEFKPLHEDEDGTVSYTKEDYKELQRNLILYKDGSQEAVTYIVRSFHPFISKYTRFIKFGILPYLHYTTKNGKTNYRVNPTISSFVSLFIQKHEKLTREERRKLFSNTCVKIRTLFSKYEYGDIYNELVLALLNMANKYKITKEGDKYHKENGTFQMYVSKCFHWEAYRFLTKLVKDPLAHLEAFNLIDQFGDMDTESTGGQVLIVDEDATKQLDRILEDTSRQNDIDNADTLTAKEEEGLSSYDLESLNFNWTNGITCSDIFSVLTPYEREIILLSFIEKKNDIEIGEIYGVHRATINNHKKKAVRKIQERAKLLNLI